MNSKKINNTNKKFEYVTRILPINNLIIGAKKGDKNEEIRADIDDIEYELFETDQFDYKYDFSRYGFNKEGIHKNGTKFYDDGYNKYMVLI